MGDWASEAKRRHEFGPLDAGIGNRTGSNVQTCSPPFPRKGQTCLDANYKRRAMGAVSEMEMQIGNFARECNLSALPVAPGDAS